MSDNFPENVEIDGVISVNQPIAQTDYLRPRYRRMTSPCAWRYAAGSLTDNLKQTNQREVKFSVPVEVSPSLATYHLACLSGMLQHVTESYNVLMARHTAPPIQPAPDPGSSGSGIVVYSGQLSAPVIGIALSPW